MGFLWFGKKQSMRCLSCADAGMKDCKAVITGKTDDEVMMKAAEHAKTAHSMTPTPDMEKKLRGLIKTM